MVTKAKELDYLVIGHVTRDLLGESSTVGGTATYSALTARNLESEAGFLTACEPDFSTPDMDGIQRFIIPSPVTTTFENLEKQHGRMQVLHHIAAKITINDIPDIIGSPKIVHLGPVADEVDCSLSDAFPDAFMGLTPQGWMRGRSEGNIVRYKEWEYADIFLSRADAVVFSIEDVLGDQSIIDEYAAKTRVLAVTEGFRGAAIYWNGDVRHFSAPEVPVVDATGAGDIFAAIFFISFFHTKDPWESAKRAVAIASDSVSRVGIKGVPTTKQMRLLQMEIIQG